MQAVDPRNGFNALDRLRMAAPLAMFPISVVAQWGLTDLRDTILDDPAKTDEQKTRTPTEKLLLAVSRAGGQIGRAHVWTPVTNAHLVCRLLLEKKKKNTTTT